VAPGESGILKLELPRNWQDFEALYLEARDPAGREIFTWSWPITGPGPANTKPDDRAGIIPSVAESDSLVTVTCSTAQYVFNRKTGYLEQIEREGNPVPFNGGPRLAGADVIPGNFSITKQNGVVEIMVDYKGKDEGDWLNATWSFDSSDVAKLEYQYRYSGDKAYMGLTFNLPLNELVKVSYLGYGPYRVWKNRLRGQRFGYWEKLPNNTVTGESYDYPEFPGYYAGVRQAVLHTRPGKITITSGDEEFFLQLYRPSNPAGASNNNTSPAFPDGDIGFLSAIAPIGTKFQSAASMGPQSQPNAMYTTTPIQGVLYFKIE
jgi:hypothetical protein